MHDHDEERRRALAEKMREERRERYTNSQLRLILDRKGAGAADETTTPAEPVNFSGTG
jgi:hypothetical protein